MQEGKSQHLKYRRFWIACGFGLVLLIIVLSLTPEAPDLGHMNDIKANHLLAYGWTMFWFAQVARRYSSRIGIGLGLLALGIALEYVQGMTGYRTFHYSDMWTDALGVFLGFILSLGPMSRGLAMLEGAFPRKGGA
jgi:hypothetical protein